MANAKSLIESNEFKPCCQFCGYNQYMIALTAHHLFPKYYFKPQPAFRRRHRYLLLCPTCHNLLHQGIFVGDGINIINNLINECEREYANYRNIENIIKLARMVYKHAYTNKDAKGL